MVSNHSSTLTPSPRRKTHTHTHTCLQSCETCGQGLISCLWCLKWSLSVSNLWHQIERKGIWLKLWINLWSFLTSSIFPPSLCGSWLLPLRLNSSLVSAYELWFHHTVCGSCHSFLITLYLPFSVSRQHMLSTDRTLKLYWQDSVCFLSCCWQVTYTINPYFNAIWTDKKEQCGPHWHVQRFKDIDKHLCWISKNVSCFQDFLT